MISQIAPSSVRFAAQLTLDDVTPGLGGRVRRVRGSNVSLEVVLAEVVVATVLAGQPRVLLVLLLYVHKNP